MNKFYITTTLPYVNAKPHIGFALEIIQADVLARYHRQKGDEVFFNTGTDEHGLKIYRKAIEEKKDPQAYCDEYAAKFNNLKKALTLSYNNFIRTTDKHHIKAAQEFWRLCDKNGDIYKKKYKTTYCVGCELEKTLSELVDGHCPTHPQTELDVIEEENYFFRYSSFQDKLLALYNKRPDFVFPASRLNEIKEFTKRGLEDFSISRLKEKMPWGVEVPGDENHIMYVWFDALVNYISALGWPEKSENFKAFWPGVQIAGTDNLRQQSSMWQAMLMSAGLEPSKEIIIHGFITADGQKMSKSLGNVVDPFELVDKYGTDALRYYLLREIPTDSDGDFSENKFIARYNGDLANGLGNFASRVLTLAEKLDSINLAPNKTIANQIQKTKEEVGKKIDARKLHEALAHIWELISFGDSYINEHEPWKLDNSNEEKVSILSDCAYILLETANLLTPFLPGTSGKIKDLITQNSSSQIKKVTKPASALFQRL